ncbi:MAG: Crp/Fnr family transcriptional regulator [Terracidiphilus sp.]
MERIDLSAALSRTALLGDLSRPEVQSLAALAVRKRFAAGEILFSEGESCKGLYIVARGRVRIFKISAGGREQLLGVEGPGGTVAELPVFDGGPYPATVAAMEETEIAFISRRSFHAFCMDHPAVALNVLSVVGARLRQLVNIIEELSFTTIRQRLIAALVRFAEGSGRQTERGVEFLLPASHQELAHQLGTVRELISRNLMRLQAEGLLDVDARQIVVRDMRGLLAARDASN